MQIQSIGSHSLAFNPNRAQVQGRGPSSPVQNDPDSDSDVQTGTSAASTAASSKSADKGAAVLRLLEAGHFNGVAELRHRIKYIDQLGGNSNSGGSTPTEPTPQTPEQIATQVNDLNAQIGSQLDTLLGTLTLDEQTIASVNDARTQYSGAVQDALLQNVGSGTINLDGLHSGLQDAFSQFVNQLHDLLTPANPDPNQVPDPNAPDPTAITNALNGITQLFAGALPDLGAPIGGTTGSGDPGSGPGDPIAPDPGHGAAYQKFLAIYNELRGVGEGSSSSLNAVA